MFPVKFTCYIFLQIFLFDQISAPDLISIGSNTKDQRCDLPPSMINEIASYKNVTEEIINYITNGPLRGSLWKSLVEFVDKFGPRYSGTDNLERAIDHMIDLFEENGLENVHTENVEVPLWSRGSESAFIIKPKYKELPMLGLGLSVATSVKGIVAESIIVRSFAELDALPIDAVTGKIVVFNQAFTNYSETGRYRMLGAIEASKKGSIAVLVRSVTPFSLATPHAGILMYDNNIPKIPAASITLEDAEMMWRMQERGQSVVVNMTMPATLDYRISRNTIGELKGSVNESNVIIVSGHIDTWDVSEGAMDNGGGSFIAWLAPVILKRMNLRPKRTVRTIMWTGEELGVFGFEGYIKNIENKNEFINAALDSDLGTFRPRGIMYQGSKDGECFMREILKLFESINATEILVPSNTKHNWLAFNVPWVGLLNDNDRYFWFHHTIADTLNVVDSDELDLCAALWAGISYILADLTENIPR